MGSFFNSGEEQQLQRLGVMTVAVLWAIPFFHPALGGALSGHDFSRFVELLLLITVAVLGVLKRDPAAQPSLCNGPAKTILRLVVVALAMLVGASIVHAAYPLVAAREVALMTGLGLFAVVQGHWLHRGQLPSVLRIISLGTAAYMATSLFLLAAMAMSDEFLLALESLFGFDNPRFLNHVMTVVLPLAVVPATLPGASRLWKRISLVGMGLSGAVLFVTYGRATPVALLVGMLGGLLMFGRRYVRYAATIVLPLLIGLVVMWCVWHMRLQASGFDIDGTELTNIHGRGFLLQLAFDQLKTSPWLGVGPMHFAHTPNIEAAHPHNIYAQLLCEYGAPATLLMLGLALMMLFRWLAPMRHVSEEELPVAAGLWTASIAVLVDGCFSGNFVMPLSQLWIAMLVGLLIAFTRAPVAPATRPVRRTMLSLLLHLLILVALVWVLGQSIVEMRASGRPQMTIPAGAQESPRRGFINPRYWTTGWF